MGCIVPTSSFAEVNCIEMGVSGCCVIFPVMSRSSTTICEFIVLSASVFGGATYSRRLLGGVVNGVCEVIVVVVEVYPEVIAVTTADPGAVLIRLDNVYVWPALMVTEAGTEAIVLFDEDRVTTMPSSGAFAGLPLESCSWTTIASYWIPSAGRIGGNP